MWSTVSCRATTTLNTYARLWPTAEDWTRKAADSMMADVRRADQVRTTGPPESGLSCGAEPELHGEAEHDRILHSCTITRYSADDVAVRTHTATSRTRSPQSLIMSSTSDVRSTAGPGSRSATSATMASMAYLCPCNLASRRRPALRRALSFVTDSTRIRDRSQLSRAM